MRADADLHRCVELLLSYDDPAATLAEVLLDQRVFCGVGNVYRCEVLWAGQLSPFAQVGTLPEADAVSARQRGATLLRANLHHAGADHHAPACRAGSPCTGATVQRCVRCDETIEAPAHGEFARVVVLVPRLPGPPRPAGRRGPTTARWIPIPPPRSSSTTSRGAPHGQPTDRRRLA